MNKKLKEKIIITMTDGVITNVFSTNPETEVAIIEFDQKCSNQDDILNQKVMDDFIDDDVFNEIKYIMGRSSNDFFDL